MALIGLLGAGRSQPDPPQAYGPSPLVKSAAPSVGQLPHRVSADQILLTLKRQPHTGGKVTLKCQGSR
jgi:hypothetical protein